ncbi:MAG: hypothetical protein HONBIEJF_00549 [Fimbriimonadaceae bacterium]|nr:hypothetical protein [Fimbriimonadaceae bacterium]
MSLEHRNLEDQLYTPDEQRQILKLAAELQSADPHLASHRELENAAEEIGIEPRFVQMAAQHLRQSKSSGRKADHLAATSLTAAFVMAQWIALFGILSGRPVLGGQGQHLWLAFGLAFVLGSALSGSDRRGLSGLIWLGSTLVLAPLAYGFVSLVGGFAEGNWPVWVMRFLGVQGATLLLGHGLGKALAKLTRRRRESLIEPNGSSLG